MNLLDEEGQPESFVALKDVAQAEEPNPAKRKDMEDASIVIDRFMGCDYLSFLGLFDGHGGKEVAKYCVENAHIIFKDLLGSRDISSLEDKELEEILSSTFKQLDEKVLDDPALSDIGCTAVICITDKKRDRLSVSNVGDSRVVLCTESGHIRATVDHRPTTEGEEERINSLGGFVRNNRVIGVIAVSRSIGDKMYKEYLQPIAHTSTFKLSEINKIVIACDGLFDVVSDEEVYKIASKHKSCSDIANELVEEAMIKDSGDNISVIVVQPNL